MDIDTITAIADPRQAAWRRGDAWLGGGSWLFSTPQPELTRLLDLHAFGWPPLEAGDDGLEVAATCTLAELAAWQPPVAWPASQLFAQCCHALLGSFKVWNVATVGGNICLALPAGPMISLTAALDGVCEIWAPDGSVRPLPVTDLVVGAGRTALLPGELLRSVRLPAGALRSRTAFRQVSLSPVGRSAALLIGRLTPDGSVALTVTASTDRPVRVDCPPDTAPAVVLARLDAMVEQYLDDVHGGAAWRRAMTHRLATEILDELRS